MASQDELAKLAGIQKEPQYRLRAAYRSCFSGPDGEIVLQDLLKFCYVGISSIVPGDPYDTHANEGRRRVAMRIVAFCNMSDEDILAIAVRKADLGEGG